MSSRELIDSGNSSLLLDHSDLNKVELEIAFSLKEKICLLVLAAGFFIPVNIPVIKFILPEMAMIFYILATGKLRYVFGKINLFLAALLFPLLIELIMPAAYFPLKRNLLICSKLIIFAFFSFTFINRCRNPKNALWFCKRMIVPLSIIMAGSFIIDQITFNTFFSNWHVTFTEGPRLFDRFADTLMMDIYMGNGFSTRVSDVPQWCFIGISSILWLYNASLIRKFHMVPLLIFFVFTVFMVPKRSSFIVLVLASIIFLFIGGFRIKKRFSFFLIACLIISFVSTQYLTNELLDKGVIRVKTLAGGYNRLIEAKLSGGGKVYDDRFLLGLQQVKYLFHHSRHLFFGAGWDFGSVVWIKPHSTVLGILAGGGIWGLVIIVLGIKKLFNHSRSLYSPENENRIYLFSLTALILQHILDSAFFFRIEYPGSLFVLWVIWSVILYGVPMPHRPEKVIYSVE